MGFWSTIGRGLKYAAPVLAATGVGGPLAAAALGAGGGLLEAGTDDDPNTRAGLGSAAGGALPAAGVSLANKYIGGSAPETVTTQAVDSVAANPPTSLGSRLVDAGRRVGGWIEDHPTLTGAALSGYGAYQEGRTEDRLLAMQEEEIERRRRRENNLDPILGALTSRIIGN